MKKLLIILLVLLSLSINAISQEVNIYKDFVGNYKVYGGLASGKIFPATAKVNFAKNNTCKWAIGDTVLEGEYLITPSAKNRDEYTLTLMYLEELYYYLKIWCYKEEHSFVLRYLELPIDNITLKAVEESEVECLKNNKKRKAIYQLTL